MWCTNMNQTFPPLLFSFSCDMSSQFSHQRLLQWNRKNSKIKFKKWIPAFWSMETCRSPESKDVFPRTISKFWCEIQITSFCSLLVYTQVSQLLFTRFILTLQIQLGLLLKLLWTHYSINKTKKKYSHWWRKTHFAQCSKLTRLLPCP